MKAAMNCFSSFSQCQIHLPKYTFIQRDGWTQHPADWFLSPI